MSTQTLSLHRRSLSDSLFLCLSVPHYQSEGLPCGPAGRGRICICIFFCQYLLWTEDQELTGEKKRAADWHLLKTFISPNLVPPVILERPLWPVGAGEGHRCWRDDGFSACGEQILQVGLHLACSRPCQRRQRAGVSGLPPVTGTPSTCKHMFSIIRIDICPTFIPQHDLKSS